MKKSLILSVLLFLCADICIFATVVDRDYAGIVAEKFLSCTSVKYVWDGMSETERLTKGGIAANPSFHLFQGTDRWVIIAGDDCSVPVLAYGEGQLDVNNMPGNMRAYLEGLGSEIAEARAKKLVPDAGTRVKWSVVGKVTKSGTGRRVEPMTADIKWNQSGSPFTDLIPYNYPVGCVPEALAIVMRYWEWPKVCKGSIPSFSSWINGVRPGVEIPAINVDGQEYKWDLLPKNVNGKTPDGSNLSDEEKRAMASFHYQVSCMCKTDWGGSDGSGALFSNCLNALKECMSYKNSITQFHRCSYTNEEWFEMLKEEIDRGRPVIVEVYMTSGSGHCMVCDGYDDDMKMVSCNWGWGGGGAGWFVVNTMNGVNSGWAGGHDAFFGIEPDRDSEYAPAFVPVYFRRDTKQPQQYYGMMMQEKGRFVKQGEDFTIELRNIANKNNSSPECDTIIYKMMLVGSGFETKAQISNEVLVPFRNNPDPSKSARSSLTSEVNCRIDCDYVIGDRINCFYTEDLHKEDKYWVKMGSQAANLNSTETYAIHEIGVYDLDIIDLPEDLKAGRALYPAMLYSGSRAFKSVEWYYDGAEEPLGKWTSVTLESGHHTIKAKVTYMDDTERVVVADFDVAE